MTFSAAEVWRLLARLTLSWSFLNSPFSCVGCSRVDKASDEVLFRSAGEPKLQLQHAARRNTVSEELLPEESTFSFLGSRPLKRAMPCTFPDSSALDASALLQQVAAITSMSLFAVRLCPVSSSCPELIQWCLITYCLLVGNRQTDPYENPHMILKNLVASFFSSRFSIP